MLKKLTCWTPVAAVLFGLCSPVSAQVSTVQRAAKGAADRAIRIGIYLNVRPDCTSGPLPTIRLINPPSHGKVTIKKGRVDATNYKQCLALQVPGYVAFYRSQSNFTGKDMLTLEVKYAAGRTEIQKITVSVGSLGQEQHI